MTFDDVMKKYSGRWENDRAIIQAEGGYYWIIAVGSPENFALTSDGRRFVTAETAQINAPQVCVSEVTETAQVKPVRRRKVLSSV